GPLEELPGGLGDASFLDARERDEGAHSEPDGSIAAEPVPRREDAPIGLGAAESAEADRRLDRALLALLVLARLGLDERPQRLDRAGTDSHSPERLAGHERELVLARVELAPRPRRRDLGELFREEADGLLVREPDELEDGVAATVGPL